VKAIECDFPIEALSPLAELESWRKEINRPIYHVHKWWATRLGSVFRAILLGTLLDEKADIWQNFYQRHNFSDIVVLDPFMGSGTTLGEALKLGCKVVGVDINPVSYYLVRSALAPVDLMALRRGFRRLESQVADRIRGYYKSTWPVTGEEADLLYAFWVKCIDCPVCGQKSHLFSKWIFATNAYPRRKPMSQVVCPKCGDIHTAHYKATETTCPTCSYVYNPQLGPARRTTFVCEHCQQEHTIAKTYHLTGQPPQHDLYALLLLLPDGQKVYKKPDEADLALYAKAVADFYASDCLYPRQAIPPGVNTDQARGYNYYYWYHMFNERQLLCLSTLLKGIMEEPESDVRQQLFLLFSGILEFNNMFCSFKGEGTGAVRPLFSHHILKPERTPLENNPWGTPKSSGSFSSLFSRRLLAARAYASDPFELQAVRHNGKLRGEKVYHINQPIRARIAKTFCELQQDKADALILARSSDQLPVPDDSVAIVITDPPYFDNVHYSELADFFHVWLKLALGEADDAFLSDSTRHEREVQGTNAEEFRNALADVFDECRRVLKSDGLLAFTFQHSRRDAWIALLGALFKAKLHVEAAYPIKAEMAVATPKSQAKEPINIDIVFVCRARQYEQWEKGENCSIEKILEDTYYLVDRLVRTGLEPSKGDIFVIAMSLFVISCQQGRWHELGHDDGASLAAVVSELETNLHLFQFGSRQRRLLEEMPAYGSSS
jgi:putative DNA methylase